MMDVCRRRAAGPRGTAVSGRLSGKTALITAAGQGIGRATALAMAAEGARGHATDGNPKPPGTVDTPSLEERIGAFADPVEARKAFIARQPMGRLAKPEEIAPIVVFLASDESVFATGNVYSVDGGMTI